MTATLLILPVVQSVDPADANMSTVQVVSLLVGIGLPLLVGLVTKSSTNSTVKSLLLVGLSCVSGFLTEYLNSSHFVWQQALLTSIVTFVVGVAAHYGVFVPTGVTAKAQRSLVKDKPHNGQNAA
jgi:hypothetical protein